MMYSMEEPNPVRSKPMSGEDLLQDAIDKSFCDPFGEACDYLDELAHPKSLLD